MDQAGLLKFINNVFPFLNFSYHINISTILWRLHSIMEILCAYQCYAPLPPVRVIVGQGGDLINLHINCPNIRDIPNNQIPLQKVGDYWGFDTRSVTVQYAETVAVLKVSSEVIKCPTIGAASFGQSPYVARLLPVRGVVGHNIDRCISLIVKAVNDTAIGIALFYLNHACHYHDVFA